ncbi:hypothetical protein BN1723_006955 [Verticillium longisporum]|uniref:Heat shock factor binding protein n=2 Tax=Verticillium TaxID=1036719 RepID=G2WUI2_VERDV|nr:uncharacterized protein VDAG_01455 [Verticillium dahliae VdLs.17]EGY17773.1 hypothetical protein VDAG_01455 [Verticillium dahliae VdLs.17]KAF3348223.1 LOG family protein [Verticillium dahliae VDG2]KAF3359324.1 hypothetical protein VdG1_02347 [Verticillium dahliae VDG1]CRK46257.1 hypothetical protein BN1723_006955 [Verticillium longisporum]
MSSSNPDQKASTPPPTVCPSAPLPLCPSWASEPTHVHHGKELTRTKNTEGGNAAGDVNAAVDELLNTISNKFAGISSEIFAKMDEMSRRLDNLETALLTDKDKDGNSNAKPA